MATKLRNNNLSNQWKNLMLILVLFAIPANWLASNFVHSNFIGRMRIDIVWATMAIGILALIIPFKILEPYPWFKKFLLLPTKTVVTLALTLSVLMIGIMPHLASMINNHHSALNASGWFGPFRNSFYIRIYWRLLNIGIWTGLFSGLALSMQHFKNQFIHKSAKETVMKDQLETNVKNHQSKKEEVHINLDEFQDSVLSIREYTEILKNQNSDEALKQDAIDKIDQLSNHLNIRIENLITFSKFKTDSSNLNLQPVNLVNLLQEVITEVEEQIGNQSVMLRTHFPEQLSLVRIDEGTMHQVFENLLMNMVKHGLPKTRAYIDVMEEDGEIKLTFRNISASEISQNMSDLLEIKETSQSGLKLMKYYTEINGGHFEIKVDGDLFKVIMTFNREDKNVK